MPRIVSNTPASPSVYTKKYEKFSGVDFSTDPATLQDDRSPYAVNIISDSGGYPEKRVGWRAIRQFEEKINGVFHLDGKMIIHTGDKMYLMESENAEPVLLVEGINDAKSFGIVFVGKLWILTGEEFLCYPHKKVDGEGNVEMVMAHVRDIATVPQVLSQADESIENGISYQPFNLLTPSRKVGIKASENYLKTITLSQEIDITSLKIYNAITGEEITGKPNSDQRYDLEEVLVGDTPPRRLHYKIIFVPSMYAAGNGEDVILEYIPKETPKAEDNRKIIERCKFAAIYENRLFVSGNPDYPNTDFYCELNDPTYFSDVGYTKVGTDDETADYKEVEERKNNYIGTGGTRILGYSYVGNYLAIHKDGAENGASLYLRSSSMNDDGMIFPIKEGIVGESIVSHRATTSFIDDPIFLTKSGVYAIASADITSERSLQSRSTRVNTKLTLEKNLENSEMAVWNGYMMLFVNGNVYVADSRQKSYVRNISNAYEYEWYFWDSIPARVVKSFKDTVYFGTEDGKVCRFNNDILDERGGYAMNAYNDGRKIWDDEDKGNPVTAYWSTKMDDMGDFELLKHLKRRGTGIHVKSFGATNIKVIVRTDHDFGEQTNYARRGLFNFQTLDFNNFTFNTQPFSFVPLGRKVKDWRMMQLICKNDEINQALGVYAIELRYTKGYFAK